MQNFVFGGLYVCNSLEQDNACWRGCCRDGREKACHEGLDSLTVGLHTLLAPVQFIATKLQAGKEAQTGPADIWQPLQLCDVEGAMVF